MRSRSGRKKEKGQILVLFEIVFIMVIAFAALVIDLGFLRNDRQMLVNAVDAGALAGGTELPVTSANVADANALIDRTIKGSYPGIQTSDYTISYDCLIGADSTGPLISRDIPAVCDPSKSLGRTPVASDFGGAGLTRFTACNPSAGDKCNVVFVNSSLDVKFNLGPIIGVPKGNTGGVSSAACKGACGAAPVVPVDLVIILDRTGSMADGSNKSGAKIQALQAAAKTVLSVYDPAKQRVALALTGPGAVDASGNPVSGTCAAGGSALGVGDDGNFSPSTTLTTTGNTNLFQGAFLGTPLTTAITTTSSTSVKVTSATGFPTTTPFTIQIDSEQMQVTAGAGTTTWTVTRGFNSTTKATHAVGAVVGWGVSKTDTSIRVASASGFPSSGNFTIVVDSEQMLVTAGQGTTIWTVTRGYNSTTTALHGGNETVSLVYGTGSTSIRVNSATGFPTSGSYTIQIDSEHLLVTAGQGTTTWTVTRGADSTTAATHTGGTAVTRIVGKTDTSIQVNDPHGPDFPSVPFMIAVGSGGSNFEHMQVTAVSGSSAPYTWTVTRAQDSQPAATHASGDSVDGIAPWVPSSATVGVWVPVGLSGTDTTDPQPNPSGTAGTYSIGGVVQTGTPIVKAINCISAFSNGTNLTTPIKMAQWYLDHYGRPGVTQGIILETDGHPQVGFESGDQTTTNQAYTCQAAADAAAAAKADTTNSPTGIQFFTIGYGVDSSSKCPTTASNWTTSNNAANRWESATYSGKSATVLLQNMATDAQHYFENPPTSQLSDVFTQAATILVQGGSHLIQLYPAPIVTGVSGAPAALSISGDYFTGASAVYFGNHPATILSVSDGSISAKITALPSGTTVDVTVVTPGGTSVITAADQYTFP